MAAYGSNRVTTPMTGLHSGEAYDGGLLELEAG